MKTLNQFVKKPINSDKIDLTPMLDVVFILLIFFVVTAIQFDESAVPVVSQEPLPEQQMPEEENLNILIEILADNRIVFNGTSIESSAVQSRVFQVLARNPQASVLVRPHKGSLAESLVAVVDAARIAGISNIRISD